MVAGVLRGPYGFLPQQKKEQKPTYLIDPNNKSLCIKIDSITSVIILNDCSGNFPCTHTCKIYAFNNKKELVKWTVKLKADAIQKAIIPLRSLQREIKSDYSNSHWHVIPFQSKNKKKHCSHNRNNDACTIS